MRIEKDIFYTEEKHASKMLDIYLPECDNFSVFVYFHGGGLEGGDKRSASVFAEYLCNRGIGVVSANYRMLPKYNYPDFIEDAASAVAWVHENINKYGKCEKIFVGGSSAGGYLSMMLCFEPKYLAIHGIDCTKIGGYVHDAGQPTCHYNVLKHNGIDPRRVIIDESAPLYHIGILPSYAPMLFIYSDSDMENPPEQTQLTVSTLKHFRYDQSKIDVICAHGTHCAYCKAIDENGDAVFGKMIYPAIEKWLSL